MSGYQKILVCVDLSEGSDRVFTAARDLAAHSQGSILALHVVEFVPIEPTGESLMSAMQMETVLVENARQRLGDFIARHKSHRPDAPNVSSRVEMGSTKSEILRVAAEERADLIVIGTRERHGLAILVNYTEDTVLHAAPCDVLAVRLS
ncbi:MAG TPA: universal stress protein [Steroidobacteraceae bacterium]|nr:universal stress protein [Steroidobacteraceae bacterium]